jgi:hypothetical protein
MFKFQLKIARVVGIVFGALYVFIGYTALVKKAVLAGVTLIVVGIGSIVLGMIQFSKKTETAAELIDKKLSEPAASPEDINELGHA